MSKEKYIKVREVLDQVEKGDRVFFRNLLAYRDPELIVSTPMISVFIATDSDSVNKEELLRMLGELRQAQDTQIANFIKRIEQL